MRDTTGGRTMADFMDTFNQDDACYIYYVDDKLLMHFLSDADCVNMDASDLNDAIYTDNFSDAVLTSYEASKTLAFLANYLFGNTHHIVRIHSHVEWL